MEVLQSLWRDLTNINGSMDGAIGFMLVAAVMEATLTQVGLEFREALFNLLPAQIIQAETAHTGGVDQLSSLG
jgi:hypothetical protein